MHKVYEVCGSVPTQRDANNTLLTITKGMLQLTKLRARFLCTGSLPRVASWSSTDIFYLKLALDFYIRSEKGLITVIGKLGDGVNI